MINIIRYLNDLNVSLITQPKLNYVGDQQDATFRNKNAHFSKLIWGDPDACEGRIYVCLLSGAE